MSTAVEVTGLRKVFGSRRSGDENVAVDGVDLVVPRGGSLAVVGESGSGKTTVARMIAGLETPTEGEIRFGGELWQPKLDGRSRREHARRVQIVFQDPFSSLDPRQTLGDALVEVLQIHFPGRSGAEHRARALELFELVGLDAQHLAKRPRALSGGQRQRFAIARALAPTPGILILDEAVSALDVSVQAQVLNLLIDLREQLGISYLFVSHDLAVVRQVTDTIIVMSGGRVVERGDTAAVLDTPAEPYTQQLLAAIPGPGWRPVARVRPAAGRVASS